MTIRIIILGVLIDILFSKLKRLQLGDLIKMIARSFLKEVLILDIIFDANSTKTKRKKHIYLIRLNKIWLFQILFVYLCVKMKCNNNNNNKKTGCC